MSQTLLVQERFPGEVTKREYFEYIAARSSKLLSLHKGKFLVEKRLQALDFVLSPSQKETPQDGSYMFHCLQDQIQYNPILQDYSENALQLRWKICQYGFDMTI